MNVQSIILLLEKTRLGTLAQLPRALKGGNSHFTYYIKTNYDTHYCIKKINPAYVREGFIESIECAEAIALAFREKEIPTVPALSFDGKHVLSINQDYYLIYNYIFAKPLSKQDLTLKCAKKMGEWFGRLHTIQLISPDAIKQNMLVSSIEDWFMLINQSQNYQLIQLKHTIKHWLRLFERYTPEILNDQIISHRDLHHQNVLADGVHHFYFVDWERAGLINAMLEIVGFALNWSGVMVKGHFNDVFLNTFLKHYLQFKKKQNTSVEAAFYGWIILYMLRWTEFNLIKMQKNAKTSSDFKEADRVIEKVMLPTLLFLKTNEMDILKKVNLIFNQCL